MVDTKRLDISSSAVEEIDPDMWKAVQNMSTVSLENNLLTQFPEVSANSFTGKQLDIQNNLMSCDCKNKWLKSWLKSIADRIPNPTGVNCHTPEWLKGKSVILLNEEEFCSGSPYTKTDVLKTSLSTVATFITLIVIVVLFSRIFRFKIYKYTKIHPFDRDECEGEDMAHDVFLSCSSEDNQVGRSILSLLESEGYKVCYHERDFMPGTPISENMNRSVERSKRVLCFLTRNFVESNFCMEEFRMAHHRDLEKGKKRMIMLLIHNFEIDNIVEADVRNYLKRYTYIEMGKPGWENQLMYAMPVRKMLREQGYAETESYGQGADTELLLHGCDSDGWNQIEADDDSLMITI